MIATVMLDHILLYSNFSKKEKLENILALLPDHVPTIVGTAVWEIHVAVAEWNDLFLELQQKVVERKQKFVLILDEAYKCCNLNYNFPVFYLDFHKIRIQRAARRNGVSPEWVSNTGKFLCLTGKPYKLQRLRLLWKYWKAGLLNKQQSVWSLFCDPNNIEHLQKLMPDVEPEQLAAWLKQHQRNPDSVPLFDHQLPRTSVYWDPEIYSLTSLSIVSAIEFENNSYPMVLCEKLWKPIVNRHPFIIAGQIGTLDRLRDQGYQTFVESLHSNYEKVDTTEQRLDYIVYNTRYFLEKYNNTNQEIVDAVEHNYTRFYQQVNRNLEDLAQWLEQHRVVDSVDTVLSAMDVDI